MKKLLLSLFILLTIQAQAQCWKEVSAGESHTMAIAKNGTLWSWGFGQSGELGYPLNELTGIPKQVGTANDWKKLDSGKWYNLLQKNDGTLWTCGHAPAMLIHSTPIYQINTDTDWKTFSCGPHFAMLIKNDGTLWGWGDNSFGETGTGSTSGAESLPTQVGTDTWKYVDAGIMHSIGIKTDGTLWTWGKLTQNGTSVLSPIQIGTDSDWEVASAGLFNNAAIKTNGTLWTWGNNGSGGLGIGTETDEENPVQVGTDTWLSVEAGMGSIHAVKTNGSLWGAGYNGFGQIGNGESGSSASTNVFVPVFNESGWKAVSSKEYFTAFINTNGELKMCGRNGVHLGLGFTPDIMSIPTPTTVICNIASLNENTLSTINVYPNPTANTLYISNTDNINIENLTIVDVTGKTLLEQKNNTSQIDVQQLPAGMYFLQITADGIKQHTKFIKN